MWGVVGDALNPVTDAIRREDRIEWIGVRHEEAAAFAVSCPGPADRPHRRLHGHRRPRARSTCSTACTTPRSPTRRCSPSCGQVPSGGDRHRLLPGGRQRQALRRRRRLGRGTLTSAEPAASAARAGRQRRRTTHRASRCSPCPATSATSTCQGRRTGPARSPRPRVPPRRARPGAAGGGRAPSTDGGHGHAARRATAPATRATQVLALADRLSAPMVLTLKAKDGLERRQPLPGRAVRADRQPGGRDGARRLRRAVHDRHRLPLPRLPTRPARRSSSSTLDGAPRRPPYVPSSPRARRRRVRHAATRCCRCSRRQDTPRTSTTCRAALRRLARRARRGCADPEHDETRLVGKVRSVFDNPDDRIRPEAVAAAVDRARRDDAIFTTDTGMSTVWLARFVGCGATRRPDRLLQPRLDGQRAAAGPRRAGPRPRRARSSRSAATAGS